MDLRWMWTGDGCGQEMDVDRRWMWCRLKEEDGKRGVAKELPKRRDRAGVGLRFRVGNGLTVKARTALTKLGSFKKGQQNKGRRRYALFDWGGKHGLVIG